LIPGPRLEENMALNREIQEYARAVAEAVWHHARTFEVPDPPLWEELDAIIASVPPPTAQHHAAPTCDIDPDRARSAKGE
jgi:hypothetical protein